MNAKNVRPPPFNGGCVINLCPFSRDCFRETDGPRRELAIVRLAADGPTRSRAEAKSLE